MAWFRLDDKFHSHAKVLEAGNAAIGLYVRCGTWSCDQRTEGKIPRHVARNFGTAKEAVTLLQCRLWVEEGDNYIMPDFLDFNPSNEEVDSKRAARAAAGSKGGQAKAKQAASKALAIASPIADVCQERGVANVYPLPDPTRPDNTTPQPPGGGVHPKQVARQAAEMLLKHEQNVSRTGPWLATVTERLLAEYDCTTLTAQQIHDLERPDALNPYAPRTNIYDPTCDLCAGSGWRTIDFDTNAVAPCTCALVALPGGGNV